VEQQWCAKVAWQDKHCTALKQKSSVRDIVTKQSGDNKREEADNDPTIHRPAAPEERTAAKPWRTM